MICYQILNIILNIRITLKIIFTLKNIFYYILLYFIINGNNYKNKQNTKKTRKIQGGNLDLYSAGKHIPKTITGFSNKKKLY